jgi:hypothetical protein
MIRFRNPFRRKLPPGDWRSKDDWAVGDLGECIGWANNWIFRADGERVPGPVPDFGDLVRVIGVDSREGGSVDVLYLDGFSGAWAAVNFRKLPQAKHEACEEEFRTLLKRSKRKVPAHA